MVDGGNSALGGVGGKSRATGESRVWALFGVVYIRAFWIVVSTVITGVTFLLFGDDCGDSFSSGLTGVGVLCIMLMVCFFC